MTVLSKRRLGGGLLFAAGLWFGRETFAWVLGKGLDAVSQSAAEITIAAFPWQNAIATVMSLVGGYIAFWPSQKLAKPSREQTLRSLYYEADSWVDRVRFDRAKDWYKRDLQGTENRVDLARTGISLALKFQNAGIAAPNFSNPSAECVSVGLENYFSALIPFMRDGHVARVESMAVYQADRAIEISDAFDPRKWFIEQS